MVLVQPCRLQLVIVWYYRIGIGYISVCTIGVDNIVVLIVHVLVLFILLRPGSIVSTSWCSPILLHFSTTSAGSDALMLLRVHVTAIHSIQ